MGAILAGALIPIGLVCHAWLTVWYAQSRGYRDEDEIRRILELAAARPGMTVADIGAGGGYYTFKLAERVGASGRVYATEIDWRMIWILRTDALVRGAANVHAVQVGEDEIGVADGALDVALMVNVFLFNDCDTDGAERYLATLRKSLKDDGRFIVWNDDIKPRGEGCRDLTPEEIAEVGSRWFRQTHVWRRAADTADSVAQPGYLLELEALGATSLREP